MTFAQPAMLAWLAAAVVPLVLHLVGQATVRSADWGAMLFLPGGAAAGSAATRGPWRARALLAVRTAAIAMVAVAAARPQWPAAWGAMPTAGLTSAGPMTVALVVDDSAAAGYARGGPPRSDAIARAALDLIGHLSAGDRACVVPDPPPPQWTDGRPSADRSAIGAQVTALLPTGRPGDRADALDRAAALLDEVDGGRQIVVVCDRSAVAWRTVTDAWGRRWRASRDRPPPRVVVVPVGGDEADNLTVESVRPVDPPLTRGVPGTVQVTIRNAGPEPRADIPLTVWAGLRPLLVTAVSIPARGATTLDVPARFDRDGPRLVSAFIRSGDGLLADDRRDGVVDVARPARVLIVAGDIAAAQPLRAALAPHAAAAQLGADPAVVTVVDATRPWSTFDLDWFDAVVLADVPPLGPDRVSRLRRLVDGGRGLLVAPGGRMTAAELNESLGVDGVGLLPARLAEPVNRPPAGLRPIDGRQPIVGRFAATSAGDAARAAVRVSRAMAVVGRPAGPVVLSAADGRPVLVVADAAGGRVALSTVPLDGRWTNLPVTPFFVPLVQSTLGWLTGGRVSGRPGEHEVFAGPADRCRRRRRDRRPGHGDAAELDPPRAGPRGPPWWPHGGPLRPGDDAGHVPVAIPVQ